MKEIEDELIRLREENAKLRASNRAFADLISIAPAFFGFLSPEGIVTDFNELAVRAAGSKSEAVIGRLFWECPWWKPIPESLAKVKQASEAAGKGQSSEFDTAYWSMLQDHGSERWVALSLFPFQDSKGNVYKISATGIDITDRKMAQDAFQHSQEQLTRAVSVSKVGFYDWDMENNRVVFSQQMKEDWGIGEQQLTLQDCFRSIHPEDGPRVAEQISDTTKTGKPYHAEYRVVRPDQKIIWVDAQGEVHYNQAGIPIRFFGTSVDITERKEIESELAAEKHKFEAIFFDSPASMALFRGKDFVLEKLNASFQSFFPGRELLGKPFLEATPELGSQPFYALMKAVFETGKTYNGREVIANLLQPSGKMQESYFDFTYTRVNDGQGQPYGVYCHSIDITEKVLARQNIEASEARFRQLADAMPQIVWTARADGTLDYSNQRWYEYTGTPLGEGDESWAQAVHPDDLQNCLVQWHRAVKEKTLYQIECRLLENRTGVYRWHLARAMAVHDPNGKVAKWFGTTTDIQDQKMNEAELVRSNAELARFAFVASHDLKEPLRVVSNYVQMLKNQYTGKLDEQADRYIGFAVSGVKRMYELIDDVLNYSKIGAAPEQFRRSDLNLTVQKVLSNLETAIKETGAQIAVGPLPVLEVEESQIQQLFQNLIENALKYCDRNRPPFIQISAYKQDCNWFFLIKDNGIGISPKYLEKIFVLFERLHGKEDYSGTGIGLAICKKILERHSGSIWAESDGIHGSTFSFQIPERKTA